MCRDALVLRTRKSDAGIATRSYIFMTLYIIMSRLSRSTKTRNGHNVRDVNVTGCHGFSQYSHGNATCCHRQLSLVLLVPSRDFSARNVIYIWTITGTSIVN